MPHPNEPLSLLLSRRSIRTYQDTPIGDDLIQGILDAAMAAPSAAGKDPWRFVVVRTKETLAAIAEGLPNGPMLSQAAVGFVICGDTTVAHGGELSYLLQDCSAAIENMLLAAHALGLGAVWLGVHPREERIAHIRRICAVPEQILPVSCIAVGYPAETKEPRTRSKQEYVHHETW